MIHLRYFLHISYCGTAYVGWQRQMNGLSIQEVLEDRLTTICNQDMQVVGCGRTDAGVHASCYYLHFDLNENLPKHFVSRLNRLLPKDIVVHNVISVGLTAHARFDALSRTYEYSVVGVKSAFHHHITYHYYQYQNLTLDKLNEAASLLMDFDEFKPFCKTNSDVNHYRCDIALSQWMHTKDEKLVYRIQANRFLRGMVRLVVGMCLNVAIGEVSLQDVRMSLLRQEQLPRPLSVPPQGLFLIDVQYPYQLG